MTRFPTRSLLLALVLSLAGGASAQTPDPAYAGWLFDHGDYFRAISAYKELFFYSNDAHAKNDYSLRIANAYLRSSKYQSSVSFASSVLGKSEVTPAQTARANVLLGLNYYGMKTFPLAQSYFMQAQPQDTSGFARYYLALLLAESARYADASDAYARVADDYPGAPFASAAYDLSREVRAGDELSSRSPVLAGVMSAVVPGLGQAYSGHYFDAVQAFAYVAAFSFASYAAYRYDKEYSSNYLMTGLGLSLLAIFHGGNIIGAYRTAEYYNMKQHRDFMGGIREKTFGVKY